MNPDHLKCLREYCRDDHAFEQLQQVLLADALRQAEIQQQQQDEQEQLLKATRLRIHRSLNLEDILSTTVEEVRKFLRADRVALGHFQPDGSGIVLAESVGAGWSSTLGTIIQLAWCQERLPAYLRGEIQAIADVQQIAYPSQAVELIQKHQIRSLLVVPILQDNCLWGFMAAHQCSETRQWQRFEISVLGHLASQLTIAIQQSELYGRMQRLNADLERQVQERTAQLQQALDFEAMLKRITDRVRDSLDEKNILEVAVQELALVLEVDGCNTALYDLNAGLYTVFYEHTTSLPSLQGQVLRIADLLEVFDQLLRKHYFQFCSCVNSSGLATLACPIFDDQGVLGDLWLFKPKEDCFTDLEIRLVQQVANHCAIALRQARIYQHVQSQVTVLENLNQLKDDFLSTVSHELRTPIANMKMAIQMLNIAPSSDRRQRYLDILQTECVREIELINDLLDLQKLEAAAYPIFLVEAIDLHEWLRSLAEPFRTRIQEHQQSLQINCPSDLPPLISDRKGLERILSELLNNACKYTQAGGAIHLDAYCQFEEVEENSETENKDKVKASRETTSRLTTQPSPTYFYIILSNQAEIPTAEMVRIFDKFYRVPNGDPWKQGGTGLGLALVQKLINQLKGTIQVESNNGWTKFIIQLPSQP